jgi:hypothetical protein
MRVLPPPEVVKVTRCGNCPFFHHNQEYCLHIARQPWSKRGEGGLPRGYNPYEAKNVPEFCPLKSQPVAVLTEED